MRTRTAFRITFAAMAVSAVGCSSSSSPPSPGTATVTASAPTAIDSDRGDRGFLADSVTLAAAHVGPAAIRHASRVTTPGSGDRETRTPIKHVVVIVGENRSFDHVYATYKPKHGRRSGTCCRAASSTKTARPDRTSGAPLSSGRRARARRTSPRPRSARVHGPPAGSRRRPDDPVCRHRRGGGGGRELDSRPATSCCSRPGARGSPRDVRHPPRELRRRSRRAPSSSPRHPLRRVHREPGAPLLPDVAAARLQRRPRDAIATRAGA